jgi:hypothetical protein
MSYIQWGGESCIALHRGACSRGLQAGKRGRSSQVSRCVSVEHSLVMSQMVSPFLPSKWSLPSLFIDARGMQGYMKSFLGRKNRSLQSCLVVGGVPLLKEWPMSFDAVATCSDICGHVDDAPTTCRVMIIPMATCLSLRFDRRREPRP